MDLTTLKIIFLLFISIKINQNTIIYLKSKINELEKELLDDKIKDIKCMIQEYDTDEYALRKKLSKDIILILYNDRDIVISNRNKKLTDNITYIWFLLSNCQTYWKFN